MQPAALSSTTELPDTLARRAAREYNTLPDHYISACWLLTSEKIISIPGIDYNFCGLATLLVVIYENLYGIGLHKWFFPLLSFSCLFVFVSLNLVVVVGQGSLLLPRGQDQAHAFEEEES